MKIIWRLTQLGCHDLLSLQLPTWSRYLSLKTGEMSFSVRSHERSKLHPRTNSSATEKLKRIIVYLWKNEVLLYFLHRRDNRGNSLDGSLTCFTRGSRPRRAHARRSSACASQTGSTVWWSHLEIFVFEPMRSTLGRATTTLIVASPSSFT